MVNKTITTKIKIKDGGVSFIENVIKALEGETISDEALGRLQEMICDSIVFERERSPWKDASKELPKKLKDQDDSWPYTCNVIGEYEGVSEIVFYDYEENTWKLKRGGKTEVTHWMYIPEIKEGE